MVSSRGANLFYGKLISSEIEARPVPVCSNKKREGPRERPRKERNHSGRCVLHVAKGSCTVSLVFSFGYPPPFRASPRASVFIDIKVSSFYGVLSFEQIINVQSEIEDTTRGDRPTPFSTIKRDS